LKNQYDGLAEKRIGEIFNINCGATVKILEYKDRNNVKILALENGEIKDGVRYDHLKDGVVKLLYCPCVYDIGYVGEEGKNINFSKKTSYKTWKSMMQRCYDKNLKKKYPEYVHATVCKDWHNYSNFKKWYDKNYYKIENQTMCLDKDILVKGNKVYSPETCVFAPERINYLFVNLVNPNRNNIIGVSPEGCGRFKVAYNKLVVDNSLLYVRKKKYFDSEIEAFLYYKYEKEKCIKIVADYYKNEIPQKLYDALYSWEVEIND
jgi:hypothetical protein